MRRLPSLYIALALCALATYTRLKGLRPSWSTRRPRGKGCVLMAEEHRKHGLSRRDVLRGGAVVGATVAVGGVTGTAGAVGRSGSDGNGQSERLRLVNGRIHTMDPARRIVSSVLIEDGRF